MNVVLLGGHTPTPRKVPYESRINNCCDYRGRGTIDATIVYFTVLKSWAGAARRFSCGFRDGGIHVVVRQ